MWSTIWVTKTLFCPLSLIVSLPLSLPYSSLVLCFFILPLLPPFLSNFVSSFRGVLSDILCFPGSGSRNEVGALGPK